MEDEGRLAHGAPERLLRHGGRLRAAAAAFPDAPTPWVDLSTGINPRPYPVRTSDLADARRLPQPEDIGRLESVAAAAFGLQDTRRIASLPGSETGLRLLPAILAARSVTIAGPTYGSHVEAWAGFRPAIVRPAEIDQADADVVLVINPNNPDGGVLSPDLLQAIAGRQARRGGWLIVDEAFADLAPENSVAAHAGGALIVLRSFGKFYGLPGVRLGFILAATDIIGRIRLLLGDWPISSAAVAAALSAYADLDWATRTRLTLARQASRLDRILAGAGIEIIGGTDLFRLGRRHDGQRFFGRLCSQGILVRPFSHDGRLLRFGLPRNGSEWRRLEAALEDNSQ